MIFLVTKIIKTISFRLTIRNVNIDFTISSADKGSVLD